LRLFYACAFVISLSAAPTSAAFIVVPQSRELPVEVQELNDNTLTLFQTGKYTEAIPLARRALELSEQALGSHHPKMAAFVNNLAELYFAVGEYAKAEPLYQRALQIREAIFPINRLNQAVSLENLGRLYQAIGQYEKAEPLLRRVLRIREKELGPNHPHVAVSLNSLAGLHLAVGEEDQAEPLFLRAIGILEVAHGPDHPDVAASLLNLALLYRTVGKYEKAEPLYQRALGIQEKALGPDHPHVAASLHALASLYRARGLYEKAAQLAQQALAIREKVLGTEHPGMAVSLSNLAWIEAAQGRHKAAFMRFQRALAIQDKFMGKVFTFTTETEKLRFVQSISGIYQACLSLIHQYLHYDKEAISAAMALVLRRKGVVFDAQSRAREALQGHLSEAARRAWDQLSSLRSELARLLLNKPEKMTRDAYTDKLASLQQRVEEAEKRLAGESALAAKELRSRTITVEIAAKALPKDSALVEFVKIPDYDFAKGTFLPSSRYLAFVLTAAGDVTRVDLGEAGVLEAKARKALEDIQASQKRLDRLSLARSHSSLESLSAVVWVPLEKSLGRANKVVVSPDGVLNLIPFTALMDGQGRPLVERYRLAYVASGRELVGAESAAPKPASDLLLVANPAFDKKGTASGGQGTSLRSSEFRGVFTPLPGTERESLEIPPLVIGRDDQKQVLVGERAQESAVKAARSPRILHLATHGFFLNDEDVEWGDETRGMELLERDLAVPPKTRGSTKMYENPLVRSGLAFAGANYAAQTTDGDDGILTALEITGMDLYGTDLVVLSACDTGVGEVQTGEGVFGLRRAFALAGAKNLLMSLWPVSDEITANQMKAFYKKLQTLPPAEALRQAQLETIEQLKAKFDGVAPPGLWAPFILQGAQALGQ
jgi:CHAT domain-containing protein/tetratricopeptide (TPR) repeat protein